MSFGRYLAILTIITLGLFAWAALFQIPNGSAYRALLALGLGAILGLIADG